jgi:hypothetical protein
MADDDTPRVEKWQVEAASAPITWTGDLNDDCTAAWAGLMLRAEEMERGVWWWAVYDERSGQVIGDSHGAERYSTGKTARAAAEATARNWLDRI